MDPSNYAILVAKMPYVSSFRIGLNIFTLFTWLTAVLSITQNEIIGGVIEALWKHGVCDVGLPAFRRL